MSDHIAHIGICDDTFGLAALHPQVHELFKRLFDQQREAAHMGCVTRHADRWTVDLIAWAAEQAADQTGRPDEMVQRKLAFVLGALTHRAADRLTKPITNCWKGQPDAADAGGDANESKIMQDIFVFKEVFAHGQGPGAEPFMPGLIEPAGSESAFQAERFFRLMLRRALISMHTIRPDSKDIHHWLDAFFENLQTFPKRIEQYAHLAAEWDPAKVRRYLIEKNFYRRTDALIELARDVQRGSTVSPAQVVEALQATDKTHSRYARALAKAMDYLLAAGELFDRRIDRETAAQRFDVGVPELSIQE
jgi:hypothetical protein